MSPLVRRMRQEERTRRSLTRTVPRTEHRGRPAGHGVWGPAGRVDGQGLQGYVAGAGALEARNWGRARSVTVPRRHRQGNAGAPSFEGPRWRPELSDGAVRWS